MKNSEYPLLAICIPTHNGGSKLIRSVENLLKCDDSRFIVHINDNVSSDDTIQNLQYLAKKDKRLVITSNETNVPAYVNFNNILIKAKAKYLFILIDKETLKIDYLKQYLDYLENETPFFGYVCYHPAKNVSYEICPKGVEAIKKISHFGSTHTTGFFYRSDLYLKENDEILRITNGGNWWITDIASLCLGFQYDGVLYYSPLNTFNYQAVLGGVSKSSFTKENLYFYGGQRCVDYELFLKIVLYKDTSDLVIPIINELNLRYIELVSYYQRCYFSDKQRCSHYGVKTRHVSYTEMIHWCKKIKKCLKMECKKSNIHVSLILFDYYAARSILKAFLFSWPLLDKVVRKIINIFR